MSTVAWLHLSDLLLRRWDLDDPEACRSTLLQDIKACINQHGIQLDLVFISGDVAFDGRHFEYALAEAFFDELLYTVGLTKERLFIVPGNHDIDRSRISPGARLISKGLTHRELVERLLNSPEDRHLMMRRFKGYADFVNSYFDDLYCFDDREFFYSRVVDLVKKRVGILGLNSVWSCAGDSDQHDGLILGVHQVRTALARVKDADLRIALMHHPFEWLREFDRNRSGSLLLAHCDFVLHSHVDSTTIVQGTSPDHRAIVIGVTPCPLQLELDNAYNLVQLDLESATAMIYLRRYVEKQGGFWTKDTLTYENALDGVMFLSVRSGA